ncbi:hypothetical protein NFX46_19785 [Streptomyces phaeoluteigriseus]|uniref:Diacylglycerol kinase n=1 Tax=Streptomyces phaeoluteigriseus TaxID=114686 RepID=A0ABY4ZBA3_9ACTN|nr:hypothetical protein [Streptomyces phaeoluteigriseus]USQ85790.1 hypothetical protein NFX46_19785 [Streptomyces phaeoluteigriseus]
MAVGVVGVALAAAGAWWVLTHTGWKRLLASLLTAAAPLVVLVVYTAAGLLWVVLVSIALWALAVSAGTAALVQDGRGRRPKRGPEMCTPALAPPRWRLTV